MIQTGNYEKLHFSIFKWTVWWRSLKCGFIVATKKLNVVMIQLGSYNGLSYLIIIYTIKC